MRDRPFDMEEVAHLLDPVIAKAERGYVSMPLSELIEEHKRIVRVLRSGSAKDRADEYAEQKRELEGYIARRKRGDDLGKSLSFDPCAPHEMGAESTYYNPYRHLSDGSFAPHSSGYWMEQAAGSMPDGEFGRRVIFEETNVQREHRRDGYTEVDRFYRQAGVIKAVMDVEIDLIVKGLGPKVSPAKPPMQHHEKVALVRHHLKKRKAKDKMEKEKALDKKIKEHVDATLSDHFETHRIQQRVHSTMQKRMSTMGPQKRATLHQVASGMGRPATPDEAAWGAVPKK